MRNPLPKCARKVNGSQIGITFVLMTLLYVSPVAAQEGLCALPGGDSMLPMAGTIIQGVIVVVGIYVLAKGIGGVTGAGRGGGGRTNLLVGVLVVMAGLLFPQIIQWIAEQAGTSLADAGLGCMWGGG